MSVTLEKYLVVPILIVAASTLSPSVPLRNKVNVDKLSVSKTSPTAFSAVSVPSSLTYAFKEGSIGVSVFSTSPPTTRLSNFELGRKLVEIRNRAISNGLTLLNLDEINAEVNGLRGNRDSGVT